MRAVVKAEMSVATFFAFWIRLVIGIIEIGVFAGLRKYVYDAVYGFVVFPRAEEVLWSDHSCTDWFTNSWDTAEVSTIPSFESQIKDNQQCMSCRRIMCQGHSFCPC